MKITKRDIAVLHDALEAIKASELDMDEVIKTGAYQRDKSMARSNAKYLSNLRERMERLLAKIEGEKGGEQIEKS